jgi:Helicase HerA, central domain
MGNRQGLYLGEELKPGAKELGPRLELDPADLLTHGLIVGMTGSGKTGLAIALIEEVLRQGVPVLAIDPKGDLGNLLLLFDDLSPAAFEPWIDPEAARREGKDVKAAAAEAAASWTKGLADWGLGTSDIAALKRSHEAAIYTPGSRSGIPLNVLQSLEAPSVSFESAAEDLRDEIAGIVAGLLGLVRIDADPLQSRESIFLSNLIESSWKAGKSLSLETLIAAVSDPPFDKVGALPLETVFPRKERQGLMMALNNLLAAPSFEAWREGVPLDVGALLRAKDGRPRLSIISTAHLADEERLFVTALLLDKVKTWMRGQGGTSELRALVYMDEIFGYFPPHPANPPTKRPLLTLLKQARAQGVGVMLATQNPVDLDYKGLANMGIWMVGTLQTEQDRARLREGLTTTGLDADALDRLLDSTRKRVFLLHDVHRANPSLLHSRWAMSYLRGPITRDEISRLMAGRAAPAPVRSANVASNGGPPVLPPPFKHNYLPKYGAELADPFLLVKYAVRYKGMAEWIAVRGYPLAVGAAAEILEAEAVEIDERALTATAPAGVRHAELPGYLAEAGAKGIEKVLKDRLADKLALTTYFDPITKEQSQPGEDRAAFAGRLGATAAGGAVAEKLRDQVDKKERELAAREADLSGRKTEKWTAIGTAVLQNIGLFTGRKRTISGAGTVLSKNRMENNAEARVEALRAEVSDLHQQLAEAQTIDPTRFEEQTLVPARTAVKILRYDLVWIS